MSDKEQRARKAKYELEITEEAHTKLRAHWLEEAVKFAGASKHSEAINALLLVKSLDTIRQMVRTPVDDWTIEQAVTKAHEPAKPN